MELVGEMLLTHLRSEHSSELDASAVRPHFVMLAGRLAGVSSRRAWNVDRFLTRFLSYPAALVGKRADFELFHVVDHSYSQLLHVLPPERTGIYCHDLDAFTPVLEPRTRFVNWRRAMARVQLSGFQRASVVFYSTRQILEQIVHHELVEASRLVHAPFGVGTEFFAEGTETDLPREVSASKPYLLHVGSSVPRKRLDVLLRVFARVRTARPDLHLVQQGAKLLPEHQELVEELGLSGALVQPPPLERRALAAVYRHSQLLILPSEREGFGLPLLEAFASGTPVVASDIPAFREVGASLATFCPIGDIDVWTDRILELLEIGRSVGSKERQARAAEFGWSAHANRIAHAYQQLLVGNSPRAVPPGSA